MGFLGNLSIILLIAISLASCSPFSDEDKGELNFKTKNPIAKIPLAPTFESLNVNFVKVSCARCHHAKQDDIPKFTTKEEIIANADDILFYAQDGCDLDLCMPPRDENGNPEAPLPTDEMLQFFEKWMENNFEDILPKIFS